MKRNGKNTSLLSDLFTLWPRASFAGWGLGLACVTALAQAAPASGTLEAYEDRVMEGSFLLDDALELKASAYNASGWPRSWHVDYSVLRQKGATDSRSRAVGIGGFLDTPNYGALSVNANLVEQTADLFGSNVLTTQQKASTWRIDQRAVPLDGGWSANHSAGNINTGMVPLTHGIGRVWVPTTQIRGAAGQWSLTDAVDLNASSGRTGVLTGIDVSGFESTGGQISSVGAQMRLPLNAANGRSDAAIQLIDGHNIADNAGGGRQDTRAFWTSAAWEGRAPWTEGLTPGYLPVSERQGGLRLQGNVLSSTGTRDGTALGLWADAAWRTERWRNTAGVFRFDPKLRWGTTVLASDLQGVYWQADTATRQWRTGFTAELSDSVSGAVAGATGRSAFMSVNGRYSLDSRSAIGATLNLRTLTSPGQALMLSWDRSSDWGQTQWRSDFAHTQASNITRLGLDQNWPVMRPASFNTSVAWERVEGGLTPTTGWIWGLLGTLSPLPQWTIDSAVRGARRSDGSQSINANLGLAWQPAIGWSLAFRYTEARGQEPLQPLVVSALTAAMLPALTPTTVNRSLQLLLRYEGRAGSSTAPLGGLPGTGAGSLSGSVYFDADANNRREASEAGVPNITVILDRRYVTRTDAQGRYEFPAVAAGEHLVEISSDNVPLPWSPALREPVKTSVQVRGTTIQDFAVQRDHAQEFTAQR